MRTLRAGNAYTWDSFVSRIHMLSLKMLKHVPFFARFYFDTAEHELSEVELVMVFCDVGDLATINVSANIGARQ